MAKYIMGIDAGTTGIRAIAFDHDSNILSNAYSEFPQYFPKEGWCEQDPNEIWDTTISMMKKCVEEGGLAWEDLVAIGIDNQRETTVFWDKETGKGVTHTITWQDMRTADRVTELNEKYQGTEFGRLGSQFTTNSTGPKIEWVINNIPEVKKGIEEGKILYGWVDTWIIWKLTGGKVHITDSSGIAGTQVIDYTKLDYHEGMLKELGIPREIMPEIVVTGKYQFETDPDVTFGYTIPIAASAGDQTAAAVGQACVKPGMVKNTYGTGSFIVMNAGENFPADLPWTSGLFFETANDIVDKQRWCIEGCANVSGSAVQWLRDGLGLVVNAKEAEELAQSVEDNGGVYFVPAFAGLPNGSDPYARGTIIGVTRGTTKAHLCRAAIEAMAYQIVETFEEMSKFAGVPVTALRADGGGAQNDFLMQFQADILGVPVERPMITETTCLGAAYLAGVKVGFWKDMDEVAEKWQCEKRFEPRLSPERRKELFEGWQRAVEHARGWLKK
ncbi:MAG: glycerol kinase GlpK [Lachnospiraceae bacterium]|nr:glycerol kinase GlpK [Lachnospiraceae bacterium]